MKIEPFPFSVIDWDFVEVTEHSGEAGVALWRTRFFGDSEKFGKMRVRMVEYSAGYMADHWCEKGHVLLCLSGELQVSLRDGRVDTLRAGMSYQVGDDAMGHRSSSPTGAKLFIAD